MSWSETDSRRLSFPKGQSSQARSVSARSVSKWGGVSSDCRKFTPSRVVPVRRRLTYDKQETKSALHARASKRRISVSVPPWSYIDNSFLPAG